MLPEQNPVPSSPSWRGTGGVIIPRRAQLIVSLKRCTESRRKVAFMQMSFAVILEHHIAAVAGQLQLQESGRCRQTSPWL